MGTVEHVLKGPSETVMSVGFSHDRIHVVSARMTELFRFRTASLAGQFHYPNLSPTNHQMEAKLLISAGVDFGCSPQTSRRYSYPEIRSGALLILMIKTYMTGWGGNMMIRDLPYTT